MTTQDVLLSFKGRIGRGTFLKWWLILTAFSLIGLGIDMAVSGEPGWIWRIFSLVQLWPSLAIFVKRWHDRNRSLWLVLLVLIPFVGILALVWLLIETFGLKGTDGENKFGPDPLEMQTT